MAKSQGRVPRLYIDDKLAAGADVVLPREASHYLVNVLRLGEGLKRACSMSATASGVAISPTLIARLLS
jgi:16S rRNA U1498 N3-methylase RsmE